MKTINDNTTPAKIKPSEEIIHLFRTKKIDEDWSFVGCKPSDTCKWTHGYHRYPAKFIPQLVEKLIDDYISHKEANINDPFMDAELLLLPQFREDLRLAELTLIKLPISSQK